jgi:hypothetical protein
MPLFYKEAKSAEITLGYSDIHREIIAHELLDYSYMYIQI